MSDPRYAALPLAATGRFTEDDGTGPEASGEIVGADDAAADAVRAGGDTDLTGANRDGDGVPVGSADAAADRERAARQTD
ncbi:hypothetical protein [Micromonospora sagamiensis]|uniref:Uncharacterized protein n=1 Tax=Micromonospora sagamiensis TaxID=47875 RepID=A0A562WFA7_9ACTN|nr:hypothetical protein [Micromonospora sagamiensis]TWJ28969.1 hypothetical protein JD81_02475 [Micromonospora sagamiensis]BCL18008.1 hypothetical protein GCM10017556_57470 [Micromonospora sagamiensis]